MARRPRYPRKRPSARASEWFRQRVVAPVARSGATQRWVVPVARSSDLGSQDPALAPPGPALAVRVPVVPSPVEVMASQEPPGSPGPHGARVAASSPYSLASRLPYRSRTSPTPARQRRPRLRRLPQGVSLAALASRRVAHARHGWPREARNHRQRRGWRQAARPQHRTVGTEEGPSAGGMGQPARVPSRVRRPRAMVTPAVLGSIRHWEDRAGDHRSSSAEKSTRPLRAAEE